MKGNEETLGNILKQNGLVPQFHELPTIFPKTLSNFTKLQNRNTKKIVENNYRFQNFVKIFLKCCQKMLSVYCDFTKAF